MFRLQLQPRWVVPFRGLIHVIESVFPKQVPFRWRSIECEWDYTSDQPPLIQSKVPLRDGSCTCWPSVWVHISKFVKVSSTMQPFASVGHAFPIGVPRMWSKGPLSIRDVHTWLWHHRAYRVWRGHCLHVTDGRVEMPISLALAPRKERWSRLFSALCDSRGMTHVRHNIEALYYLLLLCDPVSRTYNRRLTALLLVPATLEQYWRDFRTPCKIHYLSA